MKLPQVTIAIAAFNEAANIGLLLSDLVSQKTSGFRVNHIWVVSDGSTDSTVKVARSVRDPRIQVFASQKNLGKIRRVNQIHRRFTGDILVEIDADVRLSGQQVIQHVVAPFLRQPGLGISCGYIRALPPRTFVEKLAYFGFTVWDQARNSLGRRGTRYYCEGGLRAFSARFISAYQLPEGVPVSEDSYSFYFAVSRGFRVAVAKSAVVFIRLPDNISDYVRQMQRFLKAPVQMTQFFPAPLVARHDSITNQVRVRAFLVRVFKQPVTGFWYILMQMYVHFRARSYHSKAVWDVSLSTKNIS